MESLFATIICIFQLFLFVLAGGAAIYYVSYYQTRDKRLMAIMLAGYGLRMACLAVISVISYNSAGNVEGLINIDELGYTKTGALLANNMSIETIKGVYFFNPSNFWYSFFVGLFYWMFGLNPLLIKIFNCILGSVTIILVYKISEIFSDNQKVRLLSALLTAIFPTSIFINTQNLKDTIYCFLILICTYFLLKMVDELKIKYFAIFGTFYFFLQYIRWYGTMPLFIIVMCIFLYNLIQRPPREKVVATLMMLVFIFYTVGYTSTGHYIKRAAEELIVLLSTVVKATDDPSDNISSDTGISSQSSTGIYSQQPSKERSIMKEIVYNLEIAKKNMDLGDTKLNDSSEYNNLTSVLSRIPYGIVSFLFTPYIWDTKGSTLMLLAALESFAFLIMVPVFIFGLVRTDKKIYSLIIILYLVIILSMYGAITGNIGTNIRWRYSYITMGIVFVSIGLYHLYEKVSSLKRERVFSK